MRIISATDSQLTSLSGPKLHAAIAASEGRTIAAEVIAAAPPLLDNTSNPELAAAFGADLLVLNLYDTFAPQIFGLPDVDGLATGPFGFSGLGRGRTPSDVAATTGRVVGVNVEPFPNLTPELAGRAATAENAERLVAQGAQFLVVTGNPATGVTLSGIVSAVSNLKTAHPNLWVVAGKMHGAGAQEPITPDTIAQLVAAGTDCVLLPAPGTVPGVTGEIAHAWHETAHRAGALTWNAIGTSQEGASEATISQLALLSKMTGTDVHHLGDSGFFGVAPPENLLAYSTAIRGRRHTWYRMATRHR